VLFAGCYAPDGASALVLQLARHHRIQAIASRLVLREAERNLRRKAGRKAVGAFHQWLKTTTVAVVPTPDDALLRRFEALIHPKDVPILAAAVASGAEYLVTLDQRHFLTSAVRLRIKRPAVMTPGHFLKDIVHR